MGEDSTRIVVGPLEMNAAIFRGKVCVEFKCDGSDSQREIAEQLRKTLHDEADPSIAEKSGVHTMNTKFEGIPDMMDFLRSLGFSCREAMVPVPPGVRQFRIGRGSP